MKKLYCNGKKGFCPHYDGNELPDCHIVECKRFDNTGSEVIEDVFTNYGRIRNMSVDEMAELLVEQHEYGVAHEEYYQCQGGQDFDDYTKAFEYTKEWLESEVESDA